MATIRPQRCSPNWIPSDADGPLLTVKGLVTKYHDKIQRLWSMYLILF